MFAWALKIFCRLFTFHFHLGLVLGYLFYLFVFIQSTINEVDFDEDSSTFFKPRVFINKKAVLKMNSSRHVHTFNHSTVLEKWENHDPLKDKVRVVCWVLTHPSQHGRKASHIKRTWGKRCNKLLFMSTKKDKLGAVVLDVAESPWNLRRKTQEAWRYVYHNHLNDGEWFLSVEDDSYVIMENLRQFLFPFDHSFPLSFGHLMTSGKFSFVSKSPGYVLSREAVIRLIDEGFDNEQGSRDCGAISWGYDDLALGKCLDYVGVKQLDTRDSLRRLTFMPLATRKLISTANPNSVGWSRYWSSYSNEPFSQGMNCCSDKAIVFHDVTPKMTYTLEYAVYKLRAHGLRTYVNVSVSETIAARKRNRLRLLKMRKKNGAKFT